MSGFAEYEQYDAVGLAELIDSGEVSAMEGCEAAIGIIEARNPEINAVVTPMFDIVKARVEEGLPDGPFTGVPFLLKDELAPYAGVRYTRGCRSYRDHVADHDSELVRRIKAAGLVVVGRVNTPEFALMATTEPELHGPTRNPWNLEFSPGGSSGGSGAAVAAGMAPMALGSDMGGSIRIPSGWCGLFGLKPSRGRIPTDPIHGEIWLGLGTEHVLTRSVRDSAAMLDVSCRPAPEASPVLAPPQRPFYEIVDNRPAPLKIGYTTRSILNTDVHPECVRAVEEAAKLLEGLGHTVEEAAPEIDGWQAAGAWLTVCFSSVAAELGGLRAVLGRKPRPSDVEPMTWTMGLLGRAYTAADLNGALGFWHEAARAVDTFHQTYDLYLTPTTASPPPRIGELGPNPADRVLMKVVNTLQAGRLLKASGITNKLAKEGLAPVPFTQLANMTGQPAANVPLHWTADGLPCGVMITAPVGDEATILRLAAQLEEAQPWFDRRPTELG
jgi:amidase